MKKVTAVWIIFALTPLVVIALDCAVFQSAKPAIKTADDIAAAWCAAYNAKRVGITAEQAADQFCATEAQLRPWLDLVLAGEKDGVGKLGVQKECPK